MKISGFNNESLNLMRDMVSDVLSSPGNVNNENTSNRASFSPENPINNIGDYAHQVLGQNRTLVNTIA